MVGKIFAAILCGTLVANAKDCSLKAKDTLKNIIKIMEKANKDPNMENSTIRKDRVVYPKELIIRLKGKP